MRDVSDQPRTEQAGPTKGARPSGGRSLGAVMSACPSCGQKNRVPRAAKGAPRCGRCHAPLPWIVDAGDDDFAEVADAATVPVLVDLWAAWCGPCRVVGPALEKLARDRAGSLKLVKVDVDSAPLTAQRFQARSIPLLVVMRRGEIVAQQIGAAPEDALPTWLSQALA
jgi:thioredoxin 2